MMGGGIELSARVGGRKYIDHGGIVEAIGSEEFEKELLLIALNGHGESYAHGTVGLGMDQLTAQRLQKSIVELLDGLEVPNGLRNGVVGCGLQLTQKGEQQMAYLIAAVQQ